MDVIQCLTCGEKWTRGAGPDHDGAAAPMHCPDHAVRMGDADQLSAIVKKSSRSARRSSIAGHNVSRARFNLSATRSPGLWIIAALAIVAVGAWFVMAAAQSPPYPQSTAILGITWDFANKVRAAQGSDLWPTTWASDGSLYAAWGDGGGAFGSDTACRVHFGLHTLTGSPPSFTFNNLFGCKADGAGCISGVTHSAACNAPFGDPAATFGTPDGLLAVGNTLYAIVWSPGGSMLHTSTNGGQAWTESGWVFPYVAGSFVPTSFLQFGQGYAGARDGFVYLIGMNLGDSTRIYLARAPVGSIMTQSAWQYFTGTAAAPTWGAWASATAIFRDPAAAWGSGSMQYFPVLGRYIFIHLFGQIQQLHVFDAPEPWGPWTTVYYNDAWGSYGTQDVVSYNIVPKFISSNNLIFWMTFSGGGGSGSDNWDNYNLIKGTFTLPDARPAPPTGFQVR